MSSSSSSNGTGLWGVGKLHAERCHYTGDDMGSVFVYVRPIETTGVNAAHHYIVVDVPTRDKYVVYEWMKEAFHAYSAEKIRGKRCLSIGVFTVDRVYAAVSEASYYKTDYKRDYHLLTYNCNIWTEKSLEHLGQKIKVHYNCKQIAKFHYKECQRNAEQTSLVKSVLRVAIIVPIVLRGVVKEFTDEKEPIHTKEVWDGSKGLDGDW